MSVENSPITTAPPTKPLERKVLAGTFGAGITGSLTIIIQRIFDLDPELAMAIQDVVVTIAVLVAGYYVRSE